MEKKNTYFLSDLYDFIKTEKIEKGFLFSSTNNSVDPSVYHILICGENMFTKNTIQKIRFFDNDDKDTLRSQRILEEKAREDGVVDGIELEYCNGTKEIVKVFVQE